MTNNNFKLYSLQLCYRRIGTVMRFAKFFCIVICIVVLPVFAGERKSHSAKERKSPGAICCDSQITRVKTVSGNAILKDLDIHSKILPGKSNEVFVTPCSRTVNMSVAPEHSPCTVYMGEGLFVLSQRRRIFRCRCARTWTPSLSERRERERA